jgi:hypothetical protein
MGKEKERKKEKGQAWWYTVTPAIWEVEVGRSRSKSSLGKVSMIPYLN